ncbi:hypothetical protein MRB53_041026 [Persea americana]|nr:hypothetical protein MRB53_041026 [Persea americana]
MAPAGNGEIDARTWRWEQKPRKSRSDDARSMERRVVQISTAVVGEAMYQASRCGDARTSRNARRKHRVLRRLCSRDAARSGRRAERVSLGYADIRSEGSHAVTKHRPESVQMQHVGRHGSERRGTDIYAPVCPVRFQWLITTSSSTIASLLLLAIQ